MKLLWRLIGFTVFLAPLTALAILGASYFLNCLMWVSAPGASLVFPFETENGTVTLKTGPYAIDAINGFVRAEDIELIDSQGRRLVFAKGATVFAPGYTNLKESAVRIQLNCVEGDLVRNAKGEFELLRYIKPKKTDEAPIPIKISFTNSKFRFVDNFAATPHILDVAIPSLEFASADNSWRLQGSLKTFGGSTEVDARMSAAQELEVHGLTKNLDLVPAWRHVRDLRDFQDNAQAQSIDAISAVASGPFRVTWSEVKGLSVSGQPSLSVRGLRVPEWDRPIDADYSGWATHRTGAGVLKATDGLSSAEFFGQIAWQDGFAMLGKGSAKIPTLQAIPAMYRRDLPLELGANGITWSGPLRITNVDVALGGEAKADRLSFGEERFDRISSQLRTENGEWSAKILGATWNGAPVEGAIQWKQKGDSIGGFVESKSVNLGLLARRYAQQELTGSGAVKAVISGTLNRPKIDVRSNGSVGIDLGPDVGKRRGLYEIAGRLDGSKFDVDRAVLTSGDGSLIVLGDVDLHSRQLHLRVRGAGIEVADWLRDSGGLATLSIAVSGPWDAPIASGRVELLNASVNGQSAPLIVARVHADIRRMTIDEVSAVRGASRLDGSIAMVWKTRAIVGRLEGQGLQLSDFLGEGASGSFSVKNGKLAGTLDAPIASFELAAMDLVIGGVRLDSSLAEAHLDGNLLTVDRLEIASGEGGWKGEGWYNASLRSGRLRGAATQIDLEYVLPVLQNDFTIDGVVSASTDATVVDGRLGSVEVQGDVDDLKVNPTLIGSGSFEASLKDGLWKGALDLGQPERYIQIPGIVYDPGINKVDAQLVVAGIPIHEIYLAIRPKLSSSSLESRPGKISIPESTLSLLNRLNGSIDANVTISGDPADPELLIESIDLAEIEIAEKPSGTIGLSAVRKPRGKWTIGKLEWVGGPGTMQTSGTIDEHGDVAMSGDMNNFDPTWLAIFHSSFASMTGSANLHFDAEGPVSEPRVAASLDADLFREPVSADRNADPSFLLKANLGPITIDGRGILFEGDLESKGIRGGIEGRLPFEYPFVVPDTQEVDISLSVPRRRVRPNGEIEQGVLDLKTLAKEAPNLKLTGDKNTMQANVHVGGTLAKLDIGGLARADLDSIGFEGIETRLKDVVASLEFKNDAVDLAAKGTSSVDSAGNANGKMDLALRVVSPSDFAAFDGDWNRLWSSAVRGRLKLDAFRIKEVDPESGGAGDVVIGADLRFGGTAKEPTISTILPATLQQISATMPTVFPEAKPQETPKFNPKFAINYVVATAKNPAKVKAITANFDLHGAGSITGTLAELNANANLTVDRGAIRLPNARVSIEENGSVRFLFKGRQTGQGDIRLDVDLAGRTNLSSVRSGGTVQRYDVELRIRGNLLDEASTFIQARSDPPDLDQAQILNMLGQRDLLEGLANQFVGDRDRNALAKTLAGAALPTILDPFTERIALELGLEFLQLDYNAFEGASITAAKSFGNGLMFQGRRQLQEQIDGRIYFDYRLTWRPPTKFQRFRNLIFSVGADQDRPWKIAVEYGIRF